MANKNLFRTLRGALAPKATTRNDAGGPAYGLSDQAALARIAATGCLSETFYASAENQLDRVLELAARVDVDFLAKTALYARRRGHMKDMPALLCAVLASRDLDRLEEIFPEVIDNGRMLRNFVQIIRSGVTGRKSLGSGPKRLVRRWLERASDRKLLQASIGNAPSLADVVKMVHPQPKSASREAFYGWLLGRPHSFDVLPRVVSEFENWKSDRSGDVPEVPFQMLTALELGAREWAAIAGGATWQTTRMNLNAFARHGVFRFGGMTDKLAERLSNPELVRGSRVLPYQLLVAYLNTSKDVPEKVREALQDAMEVALENVPQIEGSVVVCPDVSGSMQWPVTGWQSGSSSAVRCVDVAGLVAAALLRTNRSARVLPFERGVIDLQLNPRDSVMTNARKLSEVGGGGTNCSAPLVELNRERATPDLVIFVSDNESWIDANRGGYGTAVMTEWEKLKQRNPRAKMVCIDIVPNSTTQAPDRKDVLNIGGFSDAVFEIIGSFAKDTNGTDHWIREIENETLTERIKIA